MTQPKVSFQNKTVTIPETSLTFDQMGMLEEMLNDQVILHTCDNANLVAAQKASELGKLFGLTIDPNPEDVEPEGLHVVEGTEVNEHVHEEQYQVAE